MNKTTKALSVAALATAVGLGGLAAPAAAAPSPTKTRSADSNTQVLAGIFAEINAFRASKGLPAVKYNPVVSQVSQGWSDHMAATGAFEHNPDYAASADLAGWSRAGEIIASRGDHSAAAIAQQWIDSPGHNAIMSDPAMNTAGIGVSFTGATMYGVVNFFQYSPDHAATVESPAAAGGVQPAAPAPAPEVTPEAAPEAPAVPETSAPPADSASTEVSGMNSWLAAWWAQFGAPQWRGGR